MTATPVQRFAALGDPTRQLLLERLGATGPASASELARLLPVSRQAVSKQLDLLERAGLVSARRSGRQVLWAVDAAALADTADWLLAVAARWDRSLAALKRAAEQAPEGLSGLRQDSGRRQGAAMSTCAHLEATPRTPPPAGEPGCADCVAIGGRWVHLRRCLACDQISCCDSSPSRHATAHAHATGHPVITSAEPEETWRWCYLDEVGA